MPGFDHIDVAEQAMRLASCSNKVEMLDLMGFSKDTTLLPLRLEWLPDFFAAHCMRVIKNNGRIVIGLLKAGPSQGRLGGLAFSFGF